jgi:teichoic acid transport system permease protein
MARVSEAQPHSSDLFEPGAATGVASYMHRVWALRHFISATAKAKLTARNQGMILGSVWLLLEPFLFVMVYYLIFEVVLNASRGVENFFLFLTVGRLVFATHQSAVLGAAQTLADNPAAVRDSSMPKAVLPIGSAVGTFYQWGIDLFVMLLVAIAVGAYPRPAWLLILPLSVGILALNTGIGLILSPLVAAYGDIKRALPVIFRLTFYSTGIIFPIELYVDELEHNELVWAILMANPIYGYIKAFQWAVFGFDDGYPLLAALVSIGWTLFLLPVGVLLFVRKERDVGAFRYKVGQ